MRLTLQNDRFCHRLKSSPRHPDHLTMGFQPRFAFIVGLLIATSTVASPPIDPLRCAEQITAQNRPQIEQLLRERMATFSPDRPRPADPKITALKFSPPRNKPSYGVDGSGWDGDVRFGEYEGAPVAVKFFKKNNFETNIERKPTQQDYSNKIWQSYFLLSAVATLKLAPTPYAYTVAPEAVDQLAKMAGLPRSHYYGAIIMERVFSVYQDKPSMGTNVKKLIDREYDQTMREALALLHEFGISAKDIDFTVEESGEFRFIDLDFWSIRNASGCWQGGVPCP